MRRRPSRRFLAGNLVGVTCVAVALVLGCVFGWSWVHEHQQSRSATQILVAHEYAIETSAADAVELDVIQEQLLSHQDIVIVRPSEARPRNDAGTKLALTSEEPSSTAAVRPRGTGATMPWSADGSADQEGWIYDAASLALLCGFGVFLLVQRARTRSRIPPKAATAGHASARTESDGSEPPRPDDAAAITPAAGMPNSPLSPVSDGALFEARDTGAKQAVESGSERTERSRRPEVRGSLVQKQAQPAAVPESTPGDLSPGIAAWLRTGGIAVASVRRDLPRLAIAGSGDAVIQLAMRPPMSVVHIVGNFPSRYFGVQTLESSQSLVNTTDPYNGARLLDVDPDNSVALQVRAAGPWAIEVLSLADVPSFDTSYAGDGDAVVRYTGGGSKANIVGNEARRYFGVRSISAHGATSLVNTTQPHSETSLVNPVSQFFEIQAVGFWTITVT
jgi:hypothetical protein